MTNAAAILHRAWGEILEVEGAGADLEKMHADVLALFAVQKMIETWGFDDGFEIIFSRLQDMLDRPEAYPVMAARMQSSSRLQ